MMRNRIRAAAALLAIGAAVSLTPPVRAMSQQPINVADLVGHSTHIVRGSVVSVGEGLDASRLPYTEIEVSVAETIKGSASRTLTFRQFGVQSPRPAENGRKYVGIVAGMPRYAAGDEVLLFLGPISSLGFRTTVGLGQGRFTLHGGNFENDVHNAGLFRNVGYGVNRLTDKERSMTAVQQGAVAAETFMGLVRRAVDGRWWDAPGGKVPRTPVAGLPASGAPTAAGEGGRIQ